MMGSISRRRLLCYGAAFAASPLLLNLPSPALAGKAFEVRNRWQTGNHLLSPFTLDGSVLYLNGESTVEAWDTRAGKPLWQQPLKSKAGFRPRLTETSLITSGRSQLTAWGRGDGRVHWDYQPRHELGVPVIHDGRIHLGERHRLISLDALSGEEIWSFDTIDSARIAYAPIGHQEMLLLGPGDGHLYALSASDGKLLWKVDREKDWQYLRQLGLHGDLLIAGGYHDELFGIRLSDGSIAWRFYAGNFVNSQVVADGKVCFWSPTGWIYALDAESGTVVWRHRTIDYFKKRARNWASVMAEIVAHQGRLYILAMDDVLHMLDLESGDELAAYKLPERVRPFVCLDSRDGKGVFLGSAEGEILEIDLG